MKWIHTRSATGRSPSRVPLRTMVLALCAVFALCPALAQEDAAAAGGDTSRAGGGQSDSAAAKGAAGAADGAAMTNHGIDPVTPQGGLSGLQRRANVKALASGAPRQAAGPPAAHALTAPLPVHPGTDAPRNAIGSAMPGTGLPGRDVASTTQAGIRPTGFGSAAGNLGIETRRIPVPTGAPPVLHGTGINGTTMGRMSSGPPSIGGPAKDRSGINGTLIRPAH